jgi:hypothetical protein
MANVTTSTDIDNFMQAADNAAARTSLGTPASTTTISAGTGLTGGGDLSANRTLSVSSDVVVRDSNQNITANSVIEGFSSIVASGTQVVLTVASAPSYLVTGSGGQTIRLPDATTLQNGIVYLFNNNQSSGSILINNNSGTLVASIPSGGFTAVSLLSNAIAAGSWERHEQAPSNVTWSTNTLDYAGSITSATWNGVAIAVNRGGTGATTAGSALTNLGATPSSRAINSGTGLTGGGDLTADRTLAVSYGTISGTSAQGNDSRLSDARTPTAHKSTHATGGTDALAPSDIGAAATADVQIFTSSGTWTKPANAKHVVFEMTAGGGGGGAGGKAAAGTAVYGGGGGGAGGYSRASILASDLTDTTYVVTVGASGTGAIYGGAAATSGGNSSVAPSSASTSYIARAQAGSTGAGNGAANGGTSAPGTASGGVPNQNNGANSSISGSAGGGSIAANAPVGGAAGGGISATNTPYNGGSVTNPQNTIAGSGGNASSSANGGSPAAPITRSGTSLIFNGSGGGGGGSSAWASGSGGSGANASGYGHGGGGGGATQGSGNGGNGGNGAPGVVIVTTYF